MTSAFTSANQPTISAAGTYNVGLTQEWAFPQATNVATTYSLMLFQNLTPFSQGFAACLPGGSYTVSQIIAFRCQSVADQ
jgi:hypothetical protein